MPTLTQSQSIVLGKVLEKCIVPMLDKEKYQYRFSEPYEDLLTRPDFLFSQNGKYYAAMAVTCTQDNETMNKKRWRYIDEVFQLKSYFGNRFLVINCEFGNHGAYVRSELTLTNVFFDASIYVCDMKSGPEFLEYAIKLVQASGDNADSITEQLVSSKIWNPISKQLLEQLKVIFSRKKQIAAQNQLKNIWEIESKDYRERLNRVKQGNYHDAVSYFRDSVLRGVFAGPKAMKAVFASIKNSTPLSDDVAQACTNAGIEISSRIGGKFVVDEKIITTIQAGMSYDIYYEIESQLLSYVPLKYAARDIYNNEIVERMIDKAYDVLRDKKTLTQAFFDAFVEDAYMGIEHNRVWLLDAILVYLDIPTNYLNRMYSQTYGRELVTTKVEHYISKTEMGVNMFSNKDFLLDFCKNLSELIFAEKKQLSVPPRKIDVINRYRAKKVTSIGNMPYVNPMQRYVELVLDKYGIDFHKNGIPSAISGIEGIPSSMSNIHEIYQFSINGKELWVKVIAAYDGVKDKTREMAARGRMVQYSSPRSNKRNVNLVFVYDGKWTSDLQSLLALGGWEHIIPVFKFEDFISRIRNGQINLK